MLSFVCLLVCLLVLCMCCYLLLCLCLVVLVFVLVFAIRTWRAEATERLLPGTEPTPKRRALRRRPPIGRYTRTPSIKIRVGCLPLKGGALTRHGCSTPYLRVWSRARSRTGYGRECGTLLRVADPLSARYGSRQRYLVGASESHEG